MIGVSHVRNCATELQHNLGVNYEVSSFVKPGARMNAIVNTARDGVKKLKSEDVVVIWGGANDISKNNKKSIYKTCVILSSKTKSIFW